MERYQDNAFKMSGLKKLFYKDAEDASLSSSLTNSINYILICVVGHILNILESFLQERSLKVVLDDQSSPLCITNAGVPHGISFGPTLFLSFINYLPDKVLS